MGAQHFISTKWSPNLAYAVGLIASDGNLVKGRSTINMTSKDEQLILTFQGCLGLKNKIGRKARGGSKEKKYYVLQFGSKNFYRFLLAIGLTPAKSKTLGILSIPNEYFRDFLRGCIDGDGCINQFHHPESRQIQLRVSLYSASPTFLEWIKESIARTIFVRGGWMRQGGREYVLTYGKKDSIQLLSFIYYDKNVPKLERKYAVARCFLGE